MTTDVSMLDKLQSSLVVINDDDCWNQVMSTAHDRAYVARTLAEAYNSIQRLRGALVAKGVSAVQVDWITEGGG